MSRFLSAIRRAADMELLADTLAFVVMMLFVAVVLGFAVEASDAVTAWRLAQ